LKDETVPVRLAELAVSRIVRDVNVKTPKLYLVTSTRRTFHHLSERLISQTLFLKTEYHSAGNFGYLYVDSYLIILKVDNLFLLTQELVSQYLSSLFRTNDDLTNVYILFNT
jgi:hypothetical protein